MACLFEILQKYKHKKKAHNGFTTQYSRNNCVLWYTCLCEFKTDSEIKLRKSRRDVCYRKYE